MTLLQYYLLANIYLFIFWVGYRFWLKDVIYFQSIRIYLNTAVVLSTLLPIIQFSIAAMIGSTTIATSAQDLPLVGIVYKYHLGETLSPATAQAVSLSRIVKMLLISGSFATFLIYVYNHIKIKSVIRKATEYLHLESGLKVMASDEVTIPFIYFNRIVIPDNIDEKEITHVIKHEIMHHRNAHYLDNILFSLLNMVFWANPLFLLINRALKLNHEFQVDDQILSTGVDPVSYKLSLVKYSVGHKWFSLANGLSNTNTKSRLMMINNNHIKKGKWRLFLLLPILTILFTVFCFAYIQPRPIEGPSQPMAIIAQEDSLVVEIIEPMQGKGGDDVVWPKKSIILVLMNKNSMIMIAGEVLSIENAEQKVISTYNRKIEEMNDNNADDYSDNTDFGIKIYVQKDLNADRDEYQKLVDAISIALFKLREMHSIRLYGSNYKSLASPEKEVISALIPLRIYEKQRMHNYQSH